MIRLSLAFFGMMLLLLAGCVYPQTEPVRTSESHHAESSRTQSGIVEAVKTGPGKHVQQSETIQSHHESSTTQTEQ